MVKPTPRVPCSIAPQHALCIMHDAILTWHLCLSRCGNMSKQMHLHSNFISTW